MAVKTRKCDRAIPEVAAPARECCPICGLPPYFTVKIGKKRDTVMGCTFYTRCRDLKFDDNPTVSARLRSRHFREFHEEICQECRFPIGECRERRSVKVKTRLTRTAEPVHSPLFDGPYASSAYKTGEEMKELIDAEPCTYRVKADYTAVKPDWYTE